MTGFFAGLCKCIKPGLDGQAGSGKESSTNGHNGPRLVSGSQPRVDAQVGFNLGEAPPLERFRPISSTSASSAFTEGAPQSNSAENGTRHHPDQCALDAASQHAKEHAAKPELQSPANKDLAYGEMRTSADNAVGSARYNDVRVTLSSSNNPKNAAAESTAANNPITAFCAARSQIAFAGKDVTADGWATTSGILSYRGTSYRKSLES
jgi:hypothetical protein